MSVKFNSIARLRPGAAHPPATLKGNSSSHEAWKRCIVKRLRMIAQHGLLPPDKAREKGLHVLTSSTSYDSDKELFGRALCFNHPQQHKRTIIDEVKDSLYDWANGIVTILGERSQDAPLFGNFQYRIKHGMVFMVDRTKLKTSPHHKEGFIIDEISCVKDRVSLDDIDHILVPEFIFEAAKEGFAEVKQKLIPVNGLISTRYEDAFFESIPDYEKAILAVLRERPDITFWTHGMRLPVPEEVTAIDI